MSNAFNRKSKIGNRKSGFTLLELLIVIGIILVLLSMLIPTVNQVRIQGQTASTRQMIARIEAGCATYFSDFQAYPGPFKNNQVVPVSGSTAINGQSPTPANVTSSENLYLGLAGGLKITINNGAVQTFVYDATLASGMSGPANLNPAALKRHPAYFSGDQLDATNKAGSNPAQPALAAGQWCGSGASFNGDTIVPEFLDKYSSPQPILYMRANRGAAAAGQYNTDEITTTYCNRNKQNTAWTAMTNYFVNSSNTSEPAKRDEYMLISAGPDGLYGTTDDVTNFRTR